MMHGEAARAAFGRGLAESTALDDFEQDPAHPRGIVRTRVVLRSSARPRLSPRISSRRSTGLRFTRAASSSIVVSMVNALTTCAGARQAPVATPVSGAP